MNNMSSKRSSKLMTRECCCQTFDNRKFKNAWVELFFAKCLKTNECSDKNNMNVKWNCLTCKFVLSSTSYNCKWYFQMERSDHRCFMRFWWKCLRLKNSSWDYENFKSFKCICQFTWIERSIMRIWISSFRRIMFIPRLIKKMLNSYQRWTKQHDTNYFRFTTRTYQFKERYFRSQAFKSRFNFKRYILWFW